ncbi:MAG: hypothetical protein SAQ54_01350, partial [Oscillatoria sp. PMC 1050.18]|nr:hypothetical protein [Oscillatoria sp. PMC 1050.18]
MERLLTHLLRQDNWLIGYDIDQFNSLTLKLFQQLTQYETPPKILLIENNPLKFLAAFLAAVAANSEIFLCNPNWVESEWEQVFALVQPDLVLSNNLPESILNHIIINEAKSSEASPKL